ncbi:hypothetical protein ACFL1H_07530, partial [Nanoarchaeota archaeon]
INFIIKNKGNKNITAVRVNIVGNASAISVISEEVDLFIKQQGINGSVVAYDDTIYGRTIESVEIIPAVEINNENQFCNQRVITDDHIRDC